MNMLDLNFIRENSEVVKNACKNKNVQVSVDLVLDLDKEKRELMTEIETLKAEQNKISRGGAENQAIFAQAKEIKNKIKEIEPELEKMDGELKTLLLQLPNIPFEDVPVGSSEDENKVIMTVGKKPNFSFSPKNHWQIAEPLDLIDKDRATKVAGARFAYLKGPLVILELAMFRFAFDVLTNEKILSEIAKKAKLKVSTKPFVPVLPPFMIKTEPYSAMDRLEPREERYKIEGEDLWLEGSAEHVLGTMHMNETLPENIFPIRYAGYATSFRKEAGTYGKDMEGILRMHQFNKLEMECLTTAENSLSLTLKVTS